MSDNMAYLKKVIAISTNEVIAVRRSAYPKSNYQNEYTNKGYFQAHNFVMTYDSVLDGYVISDFAPIEDGTFDVVIPQKLWTMEYGWKDVLKLVNNNGISGWTGKNKIKSLYVENADITNADMFRGSTSLQSVNVKNTSARTFYQCSNLVSATIRGDVGSSSFYQCTNLTNLEFYGNVGEDAFNGCNKLTEFESHGSNISIGTRAFSNTKLSILMLDGVTTIGSSAFRNITTLTYVKISNSENLPITIQNEAFKECAIETIVLPENISDIGFQAFADNNVTSLTLSSTIGTIIAHNQIQGGILMNNSKLASIYVIGAEDRPSGWGEYFALWQLGSPDTYHNVIYTE
jgi:hypothetical protein